MTMRGPDIELVCGLFVAALMLSGADYSVSGVVLDSQSHKPLANARVLLAPTTQRLQKIEQITKQDGRFVFSVPQTGKYTLQMIKPGYFVQAYKQSSAGVSSAIAVRDDQDTSHIVFEAKHSGVITGKITDENSEPVGNALVTVFQSMIVNGERKAVARAQTRADAVGRFRIPNLAPGNYYLCAMGRPWFADRLMQMQSTKMMTDAEPRVAGQRNDNGDVSAPQTDIREQVQPYSPDPNFHGTAFATTFYPGAQRIDEASPVSVQPGAEAQVSITLAFTKAVSVKGSINSSGEMTAGRAFLSQKFFEQNLLFLDTTVPKDGKFEFKNVPAGSYALSAVSDAASGASSWSVLQEVEVGGSDLDLTLRPGSMGTLSGHVVVEGEAAKVPLFVLLRNDKGNAARIQVDASGNFSLSRILPGHYEVASGSADYTAEYFVGPSGEHLPLTFDASGESIHRDLVLAKGAAVIEGTVEQSGSAYVGAFVLLMPKDPSQIWAYRRDQTDSDGTYRLGTIPAGDYFLAAISDGDEIPYRDPKVRERLIPAAKALHVNGGEHQEIKLDLVSAASLNLPQ